MKEKEDDWNAHDIYFMRDALFFCEFEQAVAYADAGRVIRLVDFHAIASRTVCKHPAGSLRGAWEQSRC